MTTDITLTREDTGTHAVVRVLDGHQPLTDPDAATHMDQWDAIEREASGQFAAWVEGQAAQVKAELQVFTDEVVQQHRLVRKGVAKRLGLPQIWAELPISWAELPTASEWPALANMLAGANERLKRPAKTDDMAELAKRGQRGWTPRRPEDVMREAYDRTAPVTAEFPGALPAVLSGPAPDENLPGREASPYPQQGRNRGPRSRFWRWVDEMLQRPGRWWRRKQAERDKRMGVGE